MMKGIIWAENIRRLLFAGVLFFTTLVVGTLGYYFFEDKYTILDSLYMTVITVTTVGFQEVYPLGDTGKIFTILLILSSLGILGYIVSTFTRFILEGIFRKSFKNYKMNKRIVKLKNHVIICGYGRNGKQAAQELKEHGKDLVIIDSNEKLTEKIFDEDGHLNIFGDATDDEVLKTARIEYAKALIATTPSDANNMFIVLSARQLNNKLKIISRCSDVASEIKLRHAGADNVIMPDLIGGQKMAKLVAEPDIVEFLDYILLQSIRDVSLEEVSCANMRSDFVNKSIKDLGIRDRSGANIIGLRLANGQYVFNPPPDTRLTSENQLFILGNPQQIANLRAILNAVDI